MEYHRQALTLRESIGDPIRLANSLNEMADIEYASGGHKQAESLLRRSLAIRVSVNDARGIAESFDSLATWSDARHSEPREALAQALRAARIIERTRMRIGTGEDSRVAYAEANTRYYLRILDSAAKCNDAVATFWVMQRFHNRTFLDSLSRADVPRPRSIPHELFRRERELLDRLSNAGSDTGQCNEVLALLEEFYSQDLCRYNSDYVQWRKGTPVSLRRLRESIAGLESGTEYLEVVGQNDNVYGVMVGEMPRVAVSSFRASLVADGEGKPPERLDTILFHKARFEDAVCPHIEASLKGSGALFLVPQGSLSRAPLHSLNVGGKPLVAKREVRVIPHGSLLRQLAEGNWNTGFNRVAVFGDPTEDLPGADREARQVGKRVGVRPMLRKEVTRSTVLSALENADLVHYAGHAFFDPLDPSNSGLRLKDGVLCSGHLLGCSVKASVIFLNACESGVQGVGIGSELYGFLRALLLAGARQIVCTLWPVDDVIACKFADIFYRVLMGRGSSPSTAVHEAQRALLRSYPNDLRAWAPFIIVG